MVKLKISLGVRKHIHRLYNGVNKDFSKKMSQKNSSEMSSKKNSQQSSTDNPQSVDGKQQQQQQQKPPPGVCKKEMAMMQLLAEQMKPPPLQINFKIGVPKNPRERCSFDDESVPRDGRPNRSAVDEMRKMNEGCPPLEIDPGKKPCDKKSSK